MIDDLMYYTVWFNNWHMTRKGPSHIYRQLTAILLHMMSLTYKQMMQLLTRHREHFPMSRSIYIYAYQLPHIMNESPIVTFWHPQTPHVATNLGHWTTSLILNSCRINSTIFMLFLMFHVCYRAYQLLLFWNVLFKLNEY